LMQIRHYVAWQRLDLPRLLARVDKSVIHAYRGSGMTTTLMQHIHEKYSGKILLVTPSDAMSTIFQRNYYRKYPQDFAPQVVRVVDLEEAKGKQPLPVIIDNWDGFTTVEQEILARVGFTVAGNTSEMLLQ
jgi:hypothetical protein